MKHSAWFTMFLSALTLTLCGQSPFISFQQCYGGSSIDSPLWADVQDDGSRYMGGLSSSNNGDVSGNHGGADGWVLKTKAPGTIAFQRCIGGTDFDLVLDGVGLSTGGLICAGDTRSNDGDFANQSKGSCDGFIAKLSANGNIEWAKLFGGTKCDLFNAVWPIASGGYIATGETESSNGDVTNFHGGSHDFWVVRTNENGNALLKKAYGGSDTDRSYDIWKTNDGNFIVTGETGSTDGDFPVSQGSRDVVLMKMNQNGDILWAKTFGGNSFDRGVAVRQKPNGQYVVLASTFSTTGQVSGSHGSRDIWVFTTDENGNLLNQRCIGGSDIDDPSSLSLSSDGGILIGGETYSSNGDINDSPDSQFGIGLVASLSPNLELNWVRTFGSDASGISKTVYGITAINNDGIFALATGNGVSGDITCGKGQADLWAFTLSPSVGTGEISVKPDWQIVPNPVSDMLQIQGESMAGKTIRVLVVNALGQSIFYQSSTLDEVNTALKAHLSRWPSGYYAIQVSFDYMTSSQIFIKD